MQFICFNSFNHPFYTAALRIQFQCFLISHEGFFLEDYEICFSRLLPFYRSRMQCIVDFKNGDDLNTFAKLGVEIASTEFISFHSMVCHLFLLYA